MKKRKLVTVKEIQKFLSSCRFNPNEPGPLKIILESGNPEYYETRAIELIYEAKAKFLTAQELDDYEDKIKKAIQLLVLANLLKTKKVM